MAGYRARVAVRAAAAVGGGYLVGAALAAGLAVAGPALGMARADAVLAATMLSFVAHAVAAMWAFGCSSARRAWAGVLLAAAVLGMPAWLAGWLWTPA
ncbi:DUF3649 domain-containing protein [Pigmentiphaga soli]